MSQFTDKQRLDWAFMHSNVEYDRDQLSCYATAVIPEGEPSNRHGPKAVYLARGATYRACIDQFIAGTATRID